ncbi:MAG: hypothetical protein MZW92_12990 [Comamonadaceae bacterium]|nr:hypothetical protein [Comamonadaceae bacterium]
MPHTLQSYIGGRWLGRAAGPGAAERRQRPRRWPHTHAEAIGLRRGRCAPRPPRRRAGAAGARLPAARRTAEGAGQVS